MCLSCSDCGSGEDYEEERQERIENSNHGLEAYNDPDDCLVQQNPCGCCDDNCMTCRYYLLS